MSKAFTKDDDDAGFTKPGAATSLALRPGPFRLTATGARLAEARTDPQVREALARADVLPPVRAPARASLGVTVRVVSASDGASHAYRLVSPEESALVGEGCSVDGPIGRALLGAEVGDTREVALPNRPADELEIVGLDGEAPEPSSR